MQIVARWPSGELVHLLQNACDGSHWHGGATVSTHHSRRAGAARHYATLATCDRLDNLMLLIPQEPYCAAPLRLPR
jgi:hypothetical protein